MNLFGYQIRFSKATPSAETRGELSEILAAYGYPDDFMDSELAISRREALKIPAVWTAVNTISRALASLPFDLMRKNGAGSAPAESHPLYYLTKYEPRQYVTGCKFRESVFADACFGNAFVRIYRDESGRPVQFQRLIPGSVQVDETDTGVIGYRVTTGSTNPNLEGKRTTMETLLAYEVIHIQGITLDGLKGMDVCDTHADTLRMSRNATKYGNAFFKNGAHIAGVIEVPNQASPTMIDKLRTQFNAKYRGVDKVGNTAVLDNGMKYQKIGITPQEATLNESRSFQVRETARIFGMPLHLFQDLGDTTFNNVETMSTQFVTLCLRPWAVQFEQEFALKTLTLAERKAAKGYYYRLNLNGLLRGDTTARSAFYQSGISAGWLTRNDVRQLEDLNTIEGLDKPLFPVNMTTVGPNGETEQIANNENNGTSAPSAASGN